MPTACFAFSTAMVSRTSTMTSDLGTLAALRLDDPTEQDNLVGEEPERVAKLSALVSAWRREHERDSLDPPALPQQDRERLKALGYVE